jgi:hypothetical protein
LLCCVSRWSATAPGRAARGLDGAGCARERTRRSVGARGASSVGRNPSCRRRPAAGRPRPVRRGRAGSVVVHGAHLAGTGGNAHAGTGDARTRRSAARWRRFVKSLGGDLLSHPASQAVPSALEGLTSGFGMGPGVSPPLWPPKRSGASGTPETSRTTQRARATEVSCQVLGLLVPVSSTHCCASTSGLSTRSSSRGPYQVNPAGDLILERASRLYAFSAYPFRTWPMSSAVGTTTHTPEVRPSRSSRTRDSSPQISYAHGG